MTNCQDFLELLTRLEARVRAELEALRGLEAWLRDEMEIEWLERAGSRAFGTVPR